jgi:hypothetical protein
MADGAFDVTALLFFGDVRNGTFWTGRNRPYSQAVAVNLK